MRFTEEEERLILKRSEIGTLMPDAEIDRVRAMYNAPGRYYHDWGHVLSMLSWVNHVFENVWLDGRFNTAKKQLQMSIAVVFHDLVYVVGAKDNEHRSVCLFHAFMDQCAIGTPCGIEPINMSEVDKLIMATAEHGVMESEPGMDQHVAHFMDCDLVSFAEPRWEVALQTDFDVVRELETKFTEEQIRANRRKFLGGLLAKRSIFLSSFFQQRFELQARKNIRSLLDRGL